jgi:hypothetical protein
MFESYLKELNKDVEIKESIGKIGLEKKHELYYFTLNGKKNFPFKYFEYKDEIINIEYLNFELEKIIDVQKFLNINLIEISFNSLKMILKSLSKWINNDLIKKYNLLIEETKKLYYIEYNKDNVIDVLKLITRIDKEQEKYYEFFNIIARGSSTPIADFLEILIFVLKSKLKDNDININDLFDFYWEFNESMNETGKYIFEYYENINSEVLINVEINSIEDFVNKYFEIIKG